MHSQFTDSAPSRAFGVGPSRDSEEQPQASSPTFTYMYSTCVPLRTVLGDVSFRKGVYCIPETRSQDGSCFEIAFFMTHMLVFLRVIRKDYMMASGLLIIDKWPHLLNFYRRLQLKGYECLFSWRLSADSWISIPSN